MFTNQKQYKCHALNSGPQNAATKVPNENVVPIPLVL